VKKSNFSKLAGGWPVAGRWLAGGWTVAVWWLSGGCPMWLFGGCSVAGRWLAGVWPLGLSCAGCCGRAPQIIPREANLFLLCAQMLGSAGRTDGQRLERKKKKIEGGTLECVERRGAAWSGAAEDEPLLMCNTQRDLRRAAEGTRYHQPPAS